MDFGLKMLLGFEGFTEAEEAAIDAAIPAAERLLDTIKVNAPLVQKLLPDIVAVIPAAKIILLHAKGKTGLAS